MHSFCVERMQNYAGKTMLLLLYKERNWSIINCFEDLVAILEAESRSHLKCITLSRSIYLPCTNDSESVLKVARFIQVLSLEHE